MKALVKEKNLKLELKEIPKPKLKEGYAVIKVEMAGICRTDVYVAEGTISSGKSSLVIGHEFCGTIDNVNVNKKFKIGDFVFINPLIKNGGFLGIDYDGCFSEYVLVPMDNIHKVNIKNKKLAAYIEPIAASLAPLKSKSLKKGNIAVYGNTRIAFLTAKILKAAKINVQVINESDIRSNYFDVIIETQMDTNSIDHITTLLKPKGLLILKSRRPEHFLVNLYNFVKKEIRLESYYYHDFDYSIKFAKKHAKLFSNLLGNHYSLDQYLEAFNENKKGSKKIFFKIN